MQVYRTYDSFYDWIITEAMPASGQVELVKAPKRLVDKYDRALQRWAKSRDDLEAYWMRLKTMGAIMK